MRTRYGVSPWVDTFPAARRPSFPRLRGEHDCDVLIIGGGLTGCATAQACAAAGMKPMLVEADRIGMGSTGRSTGLLLTEPGPAFKDIAGAHGLRAARGIFETWRSAAIDGAALLRRLGVKASLEKEQTLILGGRSGEKELRREFDARESAGLDVRWLTPKQVATLTKMAAVGAIRTGEGFTLDPFAATIALATL